MYFLITNDVESFSIPLNIYDPQTAKEIYKVVLPRLLNLLSKYDVQSTFYFTGKFAEMIPDAVELVMTYGHEIGCHGYSHFPGRAFDILSYKEQIMELRKAKKVIEKVSGRVKSFRAPMLRINKDTVKALERTGFTSDSSICPQRFDGLLTFGSKKKIGWLFASRKPYFMSYDSTIREGNTSILEIPISAFLIPYIGSMMRISPKITKILQKTLFREAKKSEKPIVFLFHPNECIDVKEVATTRRTDKFFEYVFADMLRQRIKLRNLGLKSLQLLEKILIDAKQAGFEFLSIGEYRKIYKST